MKEWKAAERVTQKMTRDGAITINLVTGEATRISDRAEEQDNSGVQAGHLAERAVEQGLARGALWMESIRAEQQLKSSFLAKAAHEILFSICYP